MVPSDMSDVTLYPLLPPFFSFLLLLTIAYTDIHPTLPYIVPVHTPIHVSLPLLGLLV